MSKKKEVKKKTATDKVPKLSASKRIEMLEQNMVVIHQTMYMLNDKIGKLEAQNVAFAKRLTSVVSAAQLTEEAVTAGVVAINVRELEEVVSALKENGNLVDTDVIGDQSFLVVRELNSESVEVNPRRQFLVSNENIGEDIKKQLLGKKVGDIVTPDEDKLKIEILEIYDVIEQPTENTEEPEVEAVEVDEEK